MYLITKYEKSGVKAVYNYKKKFYVITWGRQTATECTPSGPLTSYVLHATTYGVLKGTLWYQMSDGSNEVSIPLQAHNHAN